MPSLLAVVIVGGAVAPGSEPPGGGNTMVVLVSMEACCVAEAYPRVERLVAAELGALGFTVLGVTGMSTSERGRRIELGVLAEEKRALAALRIVQITAASVMVEVWVRRHGAGNPVFKSLAIRATDADEAASVIALRVVELLQAKVSEEEGVPTRSTLPESAPQPEPEQNLLPPPQTVPALSWSGRVGFGGIGSIGQVGPMATANAAVRMQGLFPSLALEVDALLSFAGDGAQQDGEAASFTIGTVRAWVLWEPLPTNLVQPSLGLGDGLLIASSRGHRSESFEAVRATTAVGYAGATVQGMIWVTERLGLLAALSAGFAIPRITIVFGGRDVARFGRPLWEGLVAVEARLP